MLPENLYNQLIKVLVDAYPEHLHWEQLTITALGEPLSTLLNPLVGTREIAGQVVQIAFDRLKHYEFLTAGRDLRPEDVELRLVIENVLGQLMRTVPRSSDPFDVCLIGRQPFINRASLRRFLKELGVSNSSRVLEIEGAPSSGKSYSWRFIDFISNEVRPAKLAVRIDVQPEHTPADLLEEILIRTGMSEATDGIPTLRGESIGTWIRKACVYTVAEIRKALWHLGGNKYDQVWIVLDFPRAGIDEQLQDLVHALAKEINECHYIRLILLGFPEPLQGLEPAPLREAVPTLDRSELRSYFRDLRDQHGKKSEPGVIDLLLEGVLAHTNNSETDYTRRLNVVVTKAVELLLEPEQ